MDEQSSEAVQGAEPTATGTSAPVEQPTETQPQEQPTANDEAETQGPPETVPYSRFQEVVAERNQLKSQSETPAQGYDSYPQYQQPQQVPNYQNAPANQLPIDPITNEIDPVQYAQYVETQARQAAAQEYQARSAWDKAERDHPELNNPTFRSATAGILQQESLRRGKLVSPTEAASILKKLTVEAQRDAVKAQNEQVRIQDSVKPIASGPQVEQKSDPAQELKNAATSAQDLHVRDRARMEWLRQNS